MPPRQRRRQHLRIALDVRSVAGHVRNAQQPDELLQDLLLMRRAPLIGGFFGRLRRGDRSQTENDGKGGSVSNCVTTHERYPQWKVVLAEPAANEKHKSTRPRA